MNIILQYCEYYSFFYYYCEYYSYDKNKNNKNVINNDPFPV